MARVNHTVQTSPVWKTGTMATDGTATELTFTAATPADDEQADLTDGSETILIWNTSTDTAYTWTVTSVKDSLGRVRDIGPVDIGFGKIHRFQPDSVEGFRQSDGKVYFEASNAAVKFAVIRTRR